MNLLRRFISSINDRRQAHSMVKEERRGSLGAKLNAASSRVDHALDELNATLTMSRSDFAAMLAQESHLSDIREVVIFSTFADICEYRSSPNGSLMKVCKHPEHEAHSTGIAACREGLCPKLLEAAKK